MAGTQRVRQSDTANADNKSDGGPPPAILQAIAQLHVIRNTNDHFVTQPGGLPGSAAALVQGTALDPA